MTNLFDRMDFQALCDELNEMPATGNMSKAQVRRMYLLLHGTRPSDWLGGLRASVERVEDTNPIEPTTRREAELHVAMELEVGAMRRERKDDPGSAEQMRFAADVLRCFGVKGLSF